MSAAWKSMKKCFKTSSMAQLTPKSSTMAAVSLNLNRSVILTNCMASFSSGMNSVLPEMHRKVTPSNP
ncbi:hypothetical protein OGAPHI_004704 [Ogataea philodendri]|uniref:Uncharacterized protein n=1 Tax=Ogataea philodendri TaxID=1378263 RepID=A0A9P8P2B6_9ASCO|nr:uncharacterized protein OGAPHI_004704 [Ogataea philodendri]KAH3663990.1 hypothetical protein OGAPHI_004704 [Ogataea philodendri]